MLINASNCTRGCTDTVRESALKVDSGSEIPCRIAEYLRQRRAGPLFYQLSYTPTPLKPEAISARRCKTWFCRCKMPPEFAAANVTLLLQRARLQLKICASSSKRALCSYGTLQLQDWTSVSTRRWFGAASRSPMVLDLSGELPLLLPNQNTIRLGERSHSLSWLADFMRRVAGGLTSGGERHVAFMRTGLLTSFRLFV